MDLDNFVSKAVTARGVNHITPDLLTALMPALDKRGYWVTRLEAAEMRGTREIANLEFSVIGADGPENWENHGDVDRHTQLVYRMIEEAKASRLLIQFRVWIEEKG